MESLYLDDARNLFLKQISDASYEGKSDLSFERLLKMIGYMMPKQVTASELVIITKIVINDIRNRVCSFPSSKVFKRAFDEFIMDTRNIDILLTYIPGFAMAALPEEFASKFVLLFRKGFFGLENEKGEDYGCIEVEPNVIDISNKDKAEVLAALYNHSKPIGAGMIQFDPRPISVELARKVLDTMGYRFSYLKGRTMKVDLSGDTVYVGRYNADNDQPGLAQRAISTCKNVGRETEELGR